jgi:uncharacterized protein
MANIVSPGVYIIEKDISNYPATIDSTTVGIVGFSQKGPVGKATLITSPQRLVDTFGEPTDDAPGQGVLGALEILEATNRVFFVRAASDDAAQASAIVNLGVCPAIAVSSNSYGVTSALTLEIRVTDNTGASGFPFTKTYTIPSGTAPNQQTALATIIGTNLDSLKVVAAYPYTVDANGNKIPGSISTGDDLEAGFIVGSFAGSGATLYVSASEAVLMPVDASGNPTGTATNALTVKGSTIQAANVAYLVESLYPGAGYNLGTKSDGAVSGNSIEIDAKGGPSFVVTLNDKGALQESFKASFIADKSFITDVINTSEDNATSDYIQGNLIEANSVVTPAKLAVFTDNLNVMTIVDTVTMVSGGVTVADANPRFVKLVQGTYALTGGTNGAPTNNYQQFIIGDPREKTGIYALDDDQLNLTIGVIPGLSDQSIQNALITLAETSQNFIACVSPPYAKDSAQEAIDWSNGLSEERTAAINSSYAAIYWPWVKTFVPSVGNDVWLDAAIYGARQIAYTAGVSELWFAPAGFIRGRLTKPSQTQTPLNQGDRDSLYSGGNAINPIVNFPQQGITIFGQRTSQREPTALDRINVRMLMIYIRKVLLLSTQRFAFEPNDSILWTQIEDTVNPLLDDIKRRRGITEFRVICDETVNTPVRVDRNEVWCKILIKPTKAAEAVVFELNVTSQSAKIVG